MYQLYCTILLATSTAAKIRLNSHFPKYSSRTLRMAILGQSDTTIMVPFFVH